MKTILKTTFGILAIIAVALAVPAAAVQATFSPVGGTTYYLASSIGSTNTTITLSSFTNRSGIKFTMSNTNTDIMYATVDPQSSNSEFISFTGISQNANGSATLTGVTRGLSDFYPFTASSTLRQPHSGRAPFVLSDAPQVFNQYAVKQNDETITGDWQGPDPENPQSYATRNYVDSAAFGGIGGASETATGTVQMATAAEAAAGTTNGSVGRLALGSNLSTSTWTASTAEGNIIAAGSGGKISPFLIATSTGLFDNATLAGTTTVTATITYSGGPTVFASSSIIAYTSSTTPSTTWTKPANLKYIVLELVAGGGSYAGGGNDGGAGAGGYCKKIIPAAALGSTETVVVGGGGSYPTRGGPSSFGSHCSATGGLNGTNTTGVAGGSGTGGDINIDGGPGTDGDTASDSRGGTGGLSALGRLGAGGGNAAGVAAGAVIVTQFFY